MLDALCSVLSAGAPQPRVPCPGTTAILGRSLCRSACPKPPVQGLLCLVALHQELVLSSDGCILCSAARTNQSVPAGTGGLRCGASPPGSPLAVLHQPGSCLQVEEGAFVKENFDELCWTLTAKKNYKPDRNGNSIVSHQDAFKLWCLFNFLSEDKYPLVMVPDEVGASCLSPGSVLGCHVPLSLPGTSFLRLPHHILQCGGGERAGGEEEPCPRKAGWAGGWGGTLRNAGASGA